MTCLRVAAIAASGLLALTPPALAAEDETDGLRLSLSSEISTTWTSNAEGTAQGRSDRILQHGETLTVTTGDEQFGLRGSIGFSQMRHERLAAHDEDEISLSLDAETYVADATKISGFLRLSYGQSGEQLDLGDATIAIRSDKWQGELGASIAHEVNRWGIEAGFAYRQTRHGDARFEGIALAPVRLEANHDLFAASAGVLHLVTDGLAARFNGMYRHVSIPDADKLAFGRSGANLVRLSAGLATTPNLRAGFALEAGGDMVFVSNGNDALYVLPYARAETILNLTDRFALRAGFETDTDLSDPSDGFAEWTLAGEIGASYALTPSARLSGRLFASHKRSVALDLGLEDRQGAEASIEMQMAEALALRAVIEQSRSTGIMPGFDETRIAMIVRAAL